MIKKCAAFFLAVLVICVSSGYSVFAQTQSGDTESLRKLKVKVAKIYSERRGKIKVKYNDGTNLKGYLTEVKDDYFSVSDAKSGKIISVPYSQVNRFDRDDIPRVGKILIAAGATFGFIVLLAAIGLASASD